VLETTAVILADALNGIGYLVLVRGTAVDGSDGDERMVGKMCLDFFINHNQQLCFSTHGGRFPRRIECGKANLPRQYINFLA
jgi:hypothetical protein